MSLISKQTAIDISRSRHLIYDSYKVQIEGKTVDTVSRELLLIQDGSHQRLVRDPFINL